MDPHARTGDGRGARPLASRSSRRISVGIAIGWMACLVGVKTATATTASPGPALRVPAGATVHFLGDSIFKGWGFGQYDHPSPLCRIPEICTLLARDNLTV